MRCLNVQTTRPKPYPRDYELTPLRMHAESMLLCVGAYAWRQRKAAKRPRFGLFFFRDVDSISATASLTVADKFIERPPCGVYRGIPAFTKAATRSANQQAALPSAVPVTRGSSLGLCSSNAHGFLHSLEESVVQLRRRSYTMKL